MNRIIVKDGDIIEYEYLGKKYIQKITKQIMINSGHIDYDIYGNYGYITEENFSKIKVLSNYEKWIKELKELEAIRTTINKEKLSISKKIANLKNKINVYKSRGK